MSIWTRTVAFVQNILVDSKGDMFVATADNVVARLAVGADNTVLTARSSADGGVAWEAPAGGQGETFNPLMLIG